MKHLLTALATRKIPLDSQESELRVLLAQAQRLRGDTKGGETWEETLEKVLVELRSHEYAQAFLKPVKKSEAWDYDRVISHPMDLQTMGRKIKSHSYMSKKAFSDDLNLIWDNCLMYNTDPNHPLRRAAQYMRKKADQIMRRIPDRHERFAPSMIEKFKFAPPPSSATSTPSKNNVLPNGVGPKPQAIKQEPGLVNGAALLATPTPSNKELVPFVPASTTTAGASSGDVAEAQSTIRVGGTDIPFEDRPALERTGEGMGTFVSLNEEMDNFLDSWDFSTPLPLSGTTRPRSSSNLTMANGTGKSPLDINQRLNQQVHDDDELAVWKVINEDSSVPLGADSLSGDEMIIKRSDSPDVLSADASKKRKSRLGDSLSPRKRPRLEKLSEPERNPLENWWYAMGSTSLLANAIPASSESGPIPNPLYIKYRDYLNSQNSPSAMQIDLASPAKQKKRRKSGSQETRKKHNLFQMMSENIRVRKRARDIAIRIADQIEDEKQGVDPEDMVPLVPLEEQAPAVTKAWAHRASLPQRRRQEFLESEITAAEAQDCMETTSMLILEHANFDSSSLSALRVLGDLAGKCIQNLGKTLKTLHETHDNKMTDEEMVLHALFSNSIGSIHDLEAYIKGDVIKHGNTLVGMLTTLEEVATKKDEPVDEEAMLKDENEVMTGLGDLGEDIYGFREMGLEMEFGLKSLVVPKRLLRPRTKVVADESGATEEVDKYPVPPTYEPLETKRIGAQIGLLREYYHHRAAALAPPPRLPTPPIVVPIAIPKPPTPDPPPAIVEPTGPPPKEPTPPPAPVFDPYNPSALSIVVPALKNTSPTPAAPPPPPAPPVVAPPAPLIGSIDALRDGLIIPDLPGLQVPLIPGAPSTDIIMAGPIVVELPPILEDDAPDPSRVKVGPLGQIHVPSAATVAKQKRQHKAAAQAKAIAAAAAAAAASNAAASGPPPVTPTNATQQQSPITPKSKKPSPKKPKKLEAAPPTATA